MAIIWVGVVAWAFVIVCVAAAAVWCCCWYDSTLSEIDSGWVRSIIMSGSYSIITYKPFVVIACAATKWWMTDRMLRCSQRSYDEALTHMLKLISHATSTLRPAGRNLVNCVSIPKYAVKINQNYFWSRLFWGYLYVNIKLLHSNFRW